MYKIFAYVGSGAGIKSHTYQYVQRLLSAAAGLSDSIAYEIFTPDDTVIKGCKSCMACFFDGVCALDKQDDMNMLKQKMLEADFILLASPVFAHHISSDTKCLIDRICYWIKAFALGGKWGMAISTTSNNGHNTAIDYLETILKCLGVYVIAKDNAALHFPNEFYNPEVFEKKISMYSEMIVKYLGGNGEIKDDSALSQNFRNCKYEAVLSHCTGTFHYQAFLDRGFFEYESYEELIKNSYGNKGE